MHRRGRFLALSLLVAGSASSVVVLARPARSEEVFFDEFGGRQGLFVPTFQLDGSPVGGAEAPEAAPASLAGSSIAALEGGGALIIDADSGELVKVDAGGKALARLAIGSGASQLVYDAAAKRAYVADRNGDEIVVVAVGKKLVAKDRWETPTEPYGLALSPDGKTLLVTTIADRSLVAIDTRKGKQRWLRALSREPRGVAISPDGASAMVGYLTTGTAERIDLAGEQRDGVHVALARPAPTFQTRAVSGFVADDTPARAFARNAFAVRFLGNGVAAIGFQESTPVQLAEGMGENTGGYGGGFTPPVTHKVAFVGAPEGAALPAVAAQIASHQPNALAWDPATDKLVVAGYGSDDLLIVSNASQASIALERHQALGQATACGPDGVAIADGKALVWCSLSRTMVTLKLADGTVAAGPEVTTSKRSELERAGLALFRAGNDFRISASGAMACSSCHPDNRADGLSWRIEGHELQTPLLTGRVAETHPYKWDGGDKDLTTSLTGTMRRLGGTGLGEEEVKQLSAYLESLPAPRKPARDKAQVARGKKLFKSDALGCDTCHAGKRFTDRSGHELGGELARVDTPSLIGLASSAPYYHDGSAATLDALLRDAALVHGMADMGELDDKQIADLVAYLETL